ncbi:MAG: ABC transporter ATP-binding protein [Anaeroplasmataceae bacterium]
MSILEVNKLNKVYKTGDISVHALKDVSFEINEGELVVVLGSSGAGKSTLLNILGGMDRPSSGDYFVNGENVCLKNSKELMLFRRDSIGFVFQFYNLMPNLTALENIMLASPSISRDDAMAVLESVGLKERANNFPFALSGGEQQRVSIARALVKKPKIILCDEPTGALDSKTGVQILELLYDMSHRDKKTVIIVTHNQTLANIADRVIRLSDGEIIDNYCNLNPDRISDVVW